MLALLAALAVMSSALRVWLLWEARAGLAGLGAIELARSLWMGLRLDAVVAATLTLPAALLALVPARGASRAIAVWSALAVVLLALALCAELGFFRYYGFRANYLVLEHAADPEVLRTLLRGYATPAWALLVTAALVASLALLRGLGTCISRGSIPRLHRLAALPLVAALVIGMRGTLDHRPLNPSAAAIGSHRVQNEITASGVFNVAYELEQKLVGKRVELAGVQPLLPREEAHARARRLLGSSGPFAPGGLDPFARRTSAPPRPGRPLNVVVVVMESFTGRLVGALGGEPALSPEFDALAREGLLLTHCYATGERTVQGLEAVLSSFPPLPGVSAVRRPEAQTGFATLASVLGSRGYDSVFFYGGQGIFDQMRSFFLGNGFRSFVEEADFAHPDFQGSWGVSDGDVFRRANRELQARWQQGTPFFAAILTVSLHAPWEFPRAGVPVLPEEIEIPAGFEREELANFLYADHALGEFVREARGLDYFRDTLFVFVADHGVHLRGRELLPAEEYRVPALFLAPGWLEPARLDAVTSQLDIAPTILGLVGGEFLSPFFGSDVRARRGDDSLAILVYGKRHYGARRADRLTVLAEGGRREAYRVDPGGSSEPVPLDRAHEEDASDSLALLQVAEELLGARRYSTVEVPGLQLGRGE